MKTICTKENKEELAKQYESLKSQYEEMNSFFELFKELSLYSETDLKGVITDISESYCNLIGYKREEIIGKKHSVLKHPLELRTKYKDLWEHISSGNSWTGELRCKDKFGNDIWYQTTIFPKINKTGEMVGYAAKRQNITDKKEIELLSITNDLTGLYNKRFFKQTFENEKNKAIKEEKNLVFLMIDVDYFKKYNDRYGHLKGDEVLKEVAKVLKLNTRRANEFAFRLGGEEFAILTSGLLLKDISTYAENIRTSIEKLKILNEDSIYRYLTVSVGVFILEKDADFSDDEIYNFADEALYKAKNQGRNRVVFYE